MKVLVSGASGFIGSALVQSLALDASFEVVAASRGSLVAPAGARSVRVPSLQAAPAWRAALYGMEGLVHAAGLAHVRGDSDDAARAFHEANVEGTLALARHAHEAGVRRFVLLSSAGVFGAGREKPYSEDDVPRPAEAYSRSKYEAEQALDDFCRSVNMEFVTIRPPLVYGPGAPGNFARLTSLVRRGLPLPLSSIDNRRSFVALGNLVDFVRNCLLQAAAAGEVFCVSDGHDVSTPRFIREIASAMQVPARLVSVPTAWLDWGARVAGRRDAFEKLSSNFLLDISKAHALLGWRPPIGLEEGLAYAVKGMRT